MTNGNGTSGASTSEGCKDGGRRDSSRRGRKSGRNDKQRGKGKRSGRDKCSASGNKRQDGLENRQQLKKPAAEKSKWQPPELPQTPIPRPLCPLCGKPIEDLASAINDKASGQAAHFDCVRAKISKAEVLKEDETISYIGGGRFGVLDTNPNNKRYLKIKKVIEWEAPGSRDGWRDDIADHFSLT